ncbi:hypothetical protein FKW77_003306 [Venturia effusa]|uniref:Conserved oligomeric Golgi complex subunit 3 n=1 Tax=Venturia effusa TaxID=50376 RepID=A0A517L707_9PEZI|nr:hypothetical protein FKW77_003306 [Venturia effusa]
MYDEGWYNSFVSKPQQENSQPVATKRRQTINEGIKADVATVEALLDDVQDEAPTLGPPPATLARRAKSYSDFYDVVRDHIRKQYKQEKTTYKKRARQNLIRTDADFGAWYNGIKRDLLHSSHEEYQLYRDQLVLTESHLNSLLSSANSALELLAGLSNSFKAVESQTTAFQAQCEHLLNDQKRTLKMADDIADNLQYYTYLEPITKRLNAPGAGRWVQTKEFSDMLSNLDACLEYMQAHPKQRESLSYRSRYRLLLTRALTLIRNHFATALKDVATDVTKRIAERQLNDTTQSALLYAKFRVPAPELKQIGFEIQRRAIPPEGAEPGTEAEYQSLMNELYQTYSATRGRILRPIIAKKMADISVAPSTSKDLISFSRSSISFIRSVCSDEYDLWNEWFASDEGLYPFLEAMMDPFYDYLRPRTIHETQLQKLCELCTLLQTRYMEDEDEDSERDSPHGPRLDFSSLIHPALEDAQTRLVFLTMATLRNEIEYYKPKPEDLDYPARANKAAFTNLKSNQPALSGRRASNGPLTPMPKTPIIVDQDSPDGHFVFEPVMQECYPTLRKAVWLLSRIYRLVHSAVFDDLAHQIVHQTTLSLHAASAQISSRASPTDAQLFLIKHLLTLKQQIVAFDIEFVSPEIHLDFSSMTSTFYELRSRGGLFNPSNLMRLVGGGLIPKVVHNMLDAKSELDGRLRTVINDFVSGFATRMTASIDDKLVMKKGSKLDVNAATVDVRLKVEKDIVFLRAKLEAYIGDVRTRETLVQAVMEQVITSYEDFFERFAHGKEGASSGTKGKASVDKVWDPRVFEEWAAGVFNVGRIGFMNDEDGEGSVVRSELGSE